jgi:FkbM family methyltransferase
MATLAGKLKSIFIPSFIRRSRPAYRPFRAALRRLGPRDIAIDCGANVGKYTQMMARTGARIFSFEPNPHAFAVLAKRFGGHANVTCLNKAVGAEGGRRNLYLDKRTNLDPVRYATASTVLSFSKNVETANPVDVESVNFVEFVQSLGGKVALVKMDVEGAEIEILEDLLRKDPAACRIDNMFVEMHDHKMPELTERGVMVRSEIARRNCQWIDLRWH